MKADPRKRQMTAQELEEIKYENTLLKSFGISLNPLERKYDTKINDEDFRLIIASEMTNHKNKIHLLQRIVYRFLPDKKEMLDKLIPIA